MRKPMGATDTKMFIRTPWIGLGAGVGSDQTLETQPALTVTTGPAPSVQEEQPIFNGAVSPDGRAQPTGSGGVSAPLVAIPDEQQITAANAAGRIVVRPAPAGSVPNYDFFLPVVSWLVYDPQNTIDPTQSFFGDFINYNARVADLRDAAAAGAKGILFVKDLPRRQLSDHYEPYEGTPWRVPAVYLGADEGRQISDALASGAAASARLVLHASYKQVETPTILATVPGQSPQQIVVDSHTDGTNAVEDNGPVAMVAMARYLAGLPSACRPRSVEFVFPTAHFSTTTTWHRRWHRWGGFSTTSTRTDASARSAYERSSS